MSGIKIIIYNTTGSEIESRIVRNNNALAQKSAIHICPSVDELKAGLVNRNGHSLISLVFVKSASELDPILDLQARGLFDDVKVIVSVPETDAAAMEKILRIRPRYYCDNETDPAVLMILLRTLKREAGLFKPPVE